MSVFDKTYLPFTSEQLKQHFIGDFHRHLKNYQDSAERYHDFLRENSNTSGIPLTDAKVPRQIEKDEKFWTITALKHIYDSPSRISLFKQSLSSAYGPEPPVKGIDRWEDCLEGNLQLIFEALIPSPPSYGEWLRENLSSRQMIPYVLDAANRKSARALEGATHVDAIIINPDNGFTWMIEAKVLSDISYLISFDNFRNQIARNIDVMLDNAARHNSVLDNRIPERSLFGLLTPEVFKKNRRSRLYGWLMDEYRQDPEALRRDLKHREGEVDWAELSKRIGWITFEEIERICPGACPWLDRQ